MASPSSSSSPILLQSQLQCLLSSPRCNCTSSPVFLANRRRRRLLIRPSTSSSDYYCKKKKQDQSTSRSFTVPFVFTDEPSSNYSPQSVDPDNIQDSLRQLADTFVLPPDYFKNLPRDLRLDLNDASFDLSNGTVIDEFSAVISVHIAFQIIRGTDLLTGSSFNLDETPPIDSICGQELGEILLNISRAWELADTSTSSNLVSMLPSLSASLTDRQKSALGKRLVSSGRRFQSMGKYGQGELQKIAQAMTMTGKLLTATTISSVTDEQPKESTRVLKFGDLQVEITPEKAYIGAAIGFVFGLISWQASQGIQGIPESSLEYANNNALSLVKSLRGALLAIFYSSTFLSGFSCVGLVLLAAQIKKKGE